MQLLELFSYIWYLIPVLAVIGVVAAVRAASQQSAAWKQFAADSGGEFSGIGWLGCVSVRLPHRDWTLVLQPHEIGTGENRTPSTHLSTTCQLARDLKFSLTARSAASDWLLSDRGKGLRSLSGFTPAPERLTGDAQFDDSFRLTGEDDDAVWELFSRSEIVALLQSLRGLHRFELSAVTPELPGGRGLLALECRGKVIDAVQLGTMRDLVAATLDRLDRVGVFDAGTLPRPN